MFHPRTSLKAFLFLALAISWSCKAYATDYIFTDGYVAASDSYKAGGGDAKWENSLNWEPEGVPGPADTVTIPGNGAHGSSVFLYSDVTVKNLNLRGVLNADSDPNAANTHSLTVTGILNWTADDTPTSTASYLGHANLKAVNIPPGGHFNIDGAGVKILESTVNNRGVTTWTGTGKIYVPARESVFNNMNTFIDGADSGYGGLSGFAVFNNSGTFIKDGSGTTDFCGPIGGGNDFCADFNNTGVVNVQSGILSLGPGTSGSSFNVSPNAELNFKREVPYTLTDGAFIRGGGAVNVQNGTLTVNGSVTVDASLQAINVGQYGTFTVTSGGTLNLGISTLNAVNAHSAINFGPASHAVLDGALNVRLVSSDALGATDAFKMVAWATDVSHTADFATKSGGAFEVKDDGIYVVPATPSSPSNDNVEAAKPLTSPAGSVSGISVAATEQYPFLKAGQSEPLYGGRHGGRSIWYKWVAPFTGDVEFTTESSGFDTLLAAYSSDPDLNYDNFLTVAGDDDALGSLSKVRFRATGGQLYYIVVDGYQRKGGVVGLNWSMAPQITPAVVSQTLTSISPAAVRIDGVDGTGFLMVDVKGTNFTTDSMVYVNGHPITGGSSDYIGPTEMKASLNAAYLSSVGTVSIQVATGDQITPQRLLQVTNYAVATAPPGGTATASTPVQRNGKAVYSLQAVVTNPGSNPVTVTPAVYEDTPLGLLVKGIKGVYNFVVGKLTGVSAEGAAPGTRVDMTVKVPASDVSLLAKPKDPGLALAAGASLISTDSASVVSHNGGSLIGNDGGNIVGQCGGCLIGQDGGTFDGTGGGESSPTTEGA